MKKTFPILFWIFLFISCSRTYIIKESAMTQPISTQPKIEISEEKVAEPIQEVIAQGAAAITSTSDIARDHAISDALRKAVEQTVGTFLNSETVVHNYSLLKDEIYAHTQGYVSSYRIIDEEELKELYQIKVLARVKLSNIESDLEAIGLLLQKIGRPRIMVVIKEFKGYSGIWDESSEIETMLIEKFTEKGFPVVDETMVKKNLRAEQIRHILDGDDKTAALLGLKLGAEVVIVGKAILSEEEKSVPYSQKLSKFYKTKINCRAINTENAEILTGASITKDIPFSEEASKSKSAKEVAEKLIKGILNKWQRQENITQIYVTGAEYKDILRLKSDILSRIRGVNKVYQRSFTGNLAILEVLSVTSSQEILDDLGTKNLGTEFKINGFSGNRIDIVFEHSAQIHSEKKEK